MPGLDVTPSVPAGRMVIQSYGDGRFRVAGDVIEGSVLVAAEACASWEAVTIADLDAIALHAALGPLDSAERPAEILIIGCGAKFVAPPKGFRAAMKELGLAVEWMDTGAACRTFNVLLGEDRRVVAAILVVD